MNRRAFLCAQNRKGVPEPHRAVFLALLSIDDLQEKQRSCLITEKTYLTNQEGTTHYYLQEFTNSLNDNQLINILLFIAGSVHPPSKITVMFNAKSGIMRGPTANTCSNILELSSTYISFQEFRREFSLVLDSEEAYQ